MAREGPVFLIFLVLLSLAWSPAHAASGGSPGIMLGSNATALTLGIYAEVETNATTGAEFEDFLADTSLIVLGSDMDLAERMLLESAKASNAWLAKAKESNDSIAARNAIQSGRHPLVLIIGGPEQNNVTAYGISSGWFNDTRTVEGGLTIKTGKLPNGAVVVAISDKMGYEAGAVKNEGAKYSPLSAIMPKEYVPAAATGISLIMLILINVGRTVFEFKALNLGRKGRKVGEGARMYRGYNVSEALAITGASVVLGISISWQYFGPSGDFFFWVVVNSIICLLAAILHEVTHRLFAHLYKIDMEYVFWPAGSALTLASSFLGNAFSIQGFILEQIPPGVEKWKVGLMKLSAPVVSAIVMVVFAYLYYQSPNPVYKTVYSTSALWAVAEILPLGSLDGKDIKEWSHTVWFVSFCLIGISYLIVTFLI